MDMMALFAILIMTIPEGPSPYYKELHSVDNQIIFWDGTLFGWVPLVDKEIEEKYRKFTRDPLFYLALYDLLQDEKRFAIAHVLLTRFVKRVPGVDFGEKVPSHWFGLRLAVGADGKVYYPHPQRQMRFLRAYWKRVLRENKLLP